MEKIAKLLEVFRPTVGKILLALVLVALFVPALEFDNGIRCIRAPCPSTSVGPLVVLLLERPVYVVSYPNLLLGFLACYALSSLAIFLEVDIFKGQRPKGLQPKGQRPPRKKK
jgi:hypothetical protein